MDALSYTDLVIAALCIIVLALGAGVALLAHIVTFTGGRAKRNRALHEWDRDEK